ncbi:TonB-dependent receptor [Hylemonella gracilis]|uniref:TonB-dependent receptor n=1 Tax=Hylemonella gracilis TaxID=80880 RepID=UPI0009DA74BB|nr:TonB-dependent receptor [Hylemonella gracilis]
MSRSHSAPHRAAPVTSPARARAPFNLRHTGPLTPVAIAILACLISDAASAQPSTPQSTALTLGEIVVSAPGGALETEQVPTSVNVLPQERIEGQPVANNWQLFEMVPGVMLTQFNQGTTSGKFSMRGFNGEGEINAVKLLIDGVPSNSNDGNMPYIDLAPSLDIESIELVRGTNDPRYGLHNIAGNANIVTRMGGDYRRVRATVGSFNTQEVQAAIGVDSGALTQNLAIIGRQSDGHREHSDSDALGFSGKWFLHSEDGQGQIGLIARHHRANAEEAGYLTKAQAKNDPDQSPSYNATDEDERRMTQLALQAERQISERLQLKGQVYSNQIYDHRYVRFSASASQQERLVDEDHVGLSATATYALGQTALGEVQLSGGVDTERQDNRSERYNTVAQVRTSQTRDQQFDFNTVGAFAQASVKPTPQLTLTPALRVDRISGDYTNQLTGARYDMNDYGLIPQPKFGAVYVYSEPLIFYGNVGRSFQVGVGTGSYKVNQSRDLEPSINDGWETGVKFRPLSSMNGRFAVWRQVASNEAVRKLNDPSNASENIGSTRREGVDLELNARPNRDLGLWFSLTAQRAEIVRAASNASNTEGKELDHVPHLISGLGVDHQVTPALSWSAWVNSQSDYYIEKTNSTPKYGGYTLLNASVSYQFSPKVALEVQGRNLTDRYYEYVWHDGTQSLHAPGAPRSVYALLNVSL